VLLEQNGFQQRFPEVELRAIPERW